MNAKTVGRPEHKEPASPDPVRLVRTVKKFAG